MQREIYGLVLVILLAPQASAQYGVNWPKQPETPMATGVQPGQQVLRISGVNDFLYTYQINVVEISTPFSPNLPSGAGGHCDVDEVKTLLEDFNKAYAAYQKLFPDTAAPAKSLQDTQNDWKTNVSKFYDKLKDEISAANVAVSKLPPDDPNKPPVKEVCEGIVKTVSDTYRDVLQKAYDQIFNGLHTVEAKFEAKSCKTEILTVTEKYKGTPTGQSVVVRLDADCDQVTASGGILLTEIQNRTYTSVPLPNQTGQFLAVGGTGKFRPVFVALTNFNFPFEPLGHKATATSGDMRLGLSIGPVIQNTTSNVSAFGWFVGGTISFLHRLYVSPGVHVGEFADFPLGFTPNQQIPANFGTLTPVKRWTSRFGIALTIKGWDISKTVKGGSDTPTPTVKQSK
jgi:hypothetical protein